MPIRVLFFGEDKGLSDASEKAAREIKRTGEAADDARGRLSGFGDGLKGVASIASGFVLGQGILKAPGFLMDAAKAAAEDEQATKRLEQAVRNTGYAFEDAGAIYDDVIAKSADLAFADDDVRDSLIYLINATNDLEEAERRHALAMDFARGAGIPLSQATKLLGKVNEENVNTFKKLGIEMDKNATEAEVLANIQARYGGQAEQYARSTAGQFEVAQLKMAEAKETIGAALLPALTAVANVVATQVIPNIERFAAYFAETVQPKIEQFLAWLGPQLIALGEWFNAEVLPRVQAFLEWLHPKLVEFGGWVEEEFRKFQQYYESDIKPALDNIQAAIEAVIAWIREHWPEIEAVIRPVLEQVQLIITTAVGVIRETFQILIDLIGGDFSGAWRNLQELIGIVWAGIQSTIENYLQLIGELLGVAWEGIKAGAEAGWELVKQAVADAWENIRTAISDAFARVEEFMRSIPGRVVAALGDLSGVLRDAGIQLIQGFIDGITSKFGDVKDTLGDLTSKATSWKGPPEVDKVLLFGSGQMLIDGLIAGLQSKFAAVRTVLTALTDEVEREIEEKLARLAELTEGILSHTPVAPPAAGLATWPPGSPQAAGSAGLPTPPASGTSPRSANRNTRSDQSTVGPGAGRNAPAAAPTYHVTVNVSGVVTNDLRRLSREMVEFLSFELKRLGERQFAGTGA